MNDDNGAIQENIHTYTRTHKRPEERHLPEQCVVEGAVAVALERQHASWNEVVREKS